MANYDLHIVNPKRARKKATRKKATRKKATRKTPAKKTSTMAKKRRKSPKRRRTTALVVAPRKRRRATRVKNPSRRRRRTSNPIGLGMIPAQVKKFLPRFAGKMVVAFVTKKLGYGGGIFGGDGSTSELGGTSWNWKQYAAAVFIATYGGKLFGKYVSGTEFSEGAWDLILTKLVWTEGIARSDWAVNNFGDGEVQYDPSSGHAMINQGGSWVNMQGGTMVEAGPMDGVMVNSGPLDGVMVEAGALDGTEGDTYYPGEVLGGSHAQSYDSGSVYGS